MEHDDGFSFGIGAFETMLVLDGRCVMFRRHMERLRSALETLGVGNRADHARIEAAVADGHLDGRVLRVEVSERNVILSDRAVPYSEGDYGRGFRLRLSEVRRNETSPFTYIKSLQYGDSIMEKRRAVAEGFDEPLFLNGRGEICEGATTNVFFAEGGRLFTPAVGCGLLPGTVRAYVIERFGAEEGVFRPEDLDRFDGCFVTNSVLGVMPVASLGDRAFRDRTTCSAVRGAYQEDLRRGLRRRSRFLHDAHRSLLRFERVGIKPRARPLRKAPVRTHGHGATEHSTEPSIFRTLGRSRPSSRTMRRPRRMCA